VISALETDTENYHRTLVTYYSTIADWDKDDLHLQTNLAKLKSSSLFDELKKLKKPSNHLVHLLTALARLPDCDSVVSKITQVAGVKPRSDVWAVATNVELDYVSQVR
jgi:hypothetical protein